MRSRLPVACFVGCVVAAGGSVRGEQQAELISVAKIWDQAEHNAFTDLIRHDDRWLCVFREGKGHVSPDGAIRVIASADGEVWESLARLTLDTWDLRDAKITLAPDGRLMLTAAAARRAPDVPEHRTMVWFSTDGRAWSQPVQIGETNFWLWRVTWHRGQAAYAVGYQTGGENLIRLYRSVDGVQFVPLVEDLLSEGRPNETSLIFLPDDTALALVRRDGSPGTAQLGISRPAFTTWRFKDLGVRLGGPQLIRLPDGRLVAAGRLYDGGARTALCWLDEKQGTLKEFLPLPSGGDTSYPGLVWHDGVLWVSYYSSHEGRTSIYLARVKLPAA